jgi:hypothetical protein
MWVRGNFIPAEESAEGLNLGRSLKVLHQVRNVSVGVLGGYESLNQFPHIKTLAFTQRDNHAEGTKLSRQGADVCKLPPLALARIRLHRPMLNQKLHKETTMQTLHDMLRERRSDKAATSGPAAPEDLRRRYSKIGISAVAAAAQFTEQRETKPTTASAAPDRSSARGWSGHR